MTGHGESLRRIEREIVAEKAATLGRAGERLAQALLEVEALRGRHDAARDVAERERLAGEHEQARDRAARARLVLLIQREAVGLRRHHDVDRQYPEPPALATRAPSGAVVSSLGAASRALGRAPRHEGVSGLAIPPGRGA